MGLTRHHPPSQVVDAFGVDFKYRRFDAREAAPRNADLLAGTKRVAAVHPWESRQAASPATPSLPLPPASLHTSPLPTTIAVAALLSRNGLTPLLQPPHRRAPQGTMFMKAEAGAEAAARPRF